MFFRINNAISDQKHSAPFFQTHTRDNTRSIRSIRVACAHARLSSQDLGIPNRFESEHQDIYLFVWLDFTFSLSFFRIVIRDRFNDLYKERREKSLNTRYEFYLVIWTRGSSISAI